MSPDIQYRIIAVLNRWNVRPCDYAVSFLKWGEIAIKTGNQTVRILPTGNDYQIQYAGHKLDGIPPAAISHLAAGLTVSLMTPRLGIYPTDKHSPEHYE